jgi:hypothetical protein
MFFSTASAMHVVATISKIPCKIRLSLRPHDFMSLLIPSPTLGRLPLTQHSNTSKRWSPANHVSMPVFRSQYFDRLPPRPDAASPSTPRPVRHPCQIPSSKQSQSQSHCLLCIGPSNGSGGHTNTRNQLPVLVHSLYSSFPSQQGHELSQIVLVRVLANAQNTFNSLFGYSAYRVSVRSVRQ